MMIAFLANSIGKWLLKKGVEKSKRVPEAIHISEMNSGLLVFDINTESRYQEILAFQKKLKVEAISQISLLGFTLEKELPSFINEEQVQVLGKKDLSLWGIPKDEFHQQLMKKDYDLMIDCTENMEVPTDYIMALVQAKTKVGKPNPENEYIFDLLIDGSKEEGVDAFSKNVIHFLKMINRK